MERQYYFCYDPLLHQFLHSKHNVKYICAAIHERTNRKFWLYERDEKVNELIKKFHQLFN